LVGCLERQHAQESLQIDLFHQRLAPAATAKTACENVTS
jgi:hypothetical protein